MTLGSTLTQVRPDASTLVITNPLFSSSFAFTSFDGAIDFAGTINLGLSGKGNSNGTGSGNLLTQFQTSAGGHTTVTYDYTAAPVPEPETYAMMLAGLAGLGLLTFAKRRKANTRKLG